MRWRRRLQRASDAQTAQQEAQKGLSDAHARWPEVRRVSSSLRELRERNHFAEAFEHAFQKGRST